MKNHSVGHWRPRLLLLLITLTICAAAIELMPRYVPALAKLRPLPHTYVGDHQNQPSSMLVVDPVTGWRLRPHVRRALGTVMFTNTYATNAQGFRTSIDAEALEGRRPIVLVGDSFTFGVGVELEETFGSLVDQALDRTDVYNLAMPGFGLDQMWLSLRHQALPLRPSLVIVCFISESFPRSLDAYRMTEGWNKPAFKLVRGQLVAKTPVDRPGPLGRFLENNSVLWRVGVLASRSLGQFWPHGESWALNSALLRQMQADARAQGAPLMFVFVPTYYWRSFPAAIRYLRELGADVLDLSEQPGLDFETMYYPGDGHLTAAGHRWVADVLLRRIRERHSDLAQPGQTTAR